MKTFVSSTAACLAFVAAVNASATELYVDGVRNAPIVPYDEEILPKAARLVLEPGQYRMRISSGKFSYGNTTPPEPFVMVYFEGQIRPTLQDQPWPITWRVLQGNEVFTFDTLAQTTLYAVFLDRNEKNNSGGVTLEVKPRATE